MKLRYHQLIERITWHSDELRGGCSPLLKWARLMDHA
jgi:hypothetical protein